MQFGKKFPSSSSVPGKEKSCRGEKQMTLHKAKTKHKLHHVLFKNANYQQPLYRQNAVSACCMLFALRSGSCVWSMLPLTSEWRWVLFFSSCAKEDMERTRTRQSAGTISIICKVMQQDVVRKRNLFSLVYHRIVDSSCSKTCSMTCLTNDMSHPRTCFSVSMWYASGCNMRA